jgi:hypothetical protein
VNVRYIFAQEISNVIADADTESRDVDSEAVTRQLYQASQKPDDEDESGGVNIERERGILDINPPGRKKEFSAENISLALKQMSQENSFEVTMDLLWLSLYGRIGTFPIFFLPRIDDGSRNNIKFIYFDVSLYNWGDSPASLVIKWRQDKPSRVLAGEGRMLKMYQDDGGVEKLREFFEELKQLGETTILANQESWRQYFFYSSLSRKSS